jgi:hypothetical protein
MKKIKWAIMTVAVLVSIGGAVASRLNQNCTYAPQYYQVGLGYVPAGTMGVTYICELASQTCTYYIVGGTTYVPCQAGAYTKIAATDSKKKPK